MAGVRGNHFLGLLAMRTVQGFNDAVDEEAKIQVEFFVVSSINLLVSREDATKTGVETRFGCGFPADDHAQYGVGDSGGVGPVYIKSVEGEFVATRTLEKGGSTKQAS